MILWGSALGRFAKYLRFLRHPFPKRAVSASQVDEIMEDLRDEVGDVEDLPDGAGDWPPEWMRFSYKKGFKVEWR